MNYYQAIFFDLNGTLIDIWTDENQESLYRTIAHLLSTYGVEISMENFRTRFYELMKKQRKASASEHPEFDVVAIFRSLLADADKDVFNRLPQALQNVLPQWFAEVFRAASMMRLATYPDVHKILDELQNRNYQLAAVSDAQKIWAETELRRLKLTKYFPLRVISSDLGCRKPAPELFETACRRLGVEPEKVIFVGNDTFRDVYGAKKCGMKSVFFRSNQGDQSDHGVPADYIIYHFGELLNAIDFLEEKAKGEFAK